MSGAPDIWRLGLEDVSAAADVLSRAFMDDRFFAVCIPDRDLRLIHLPPFFSACLRYGCHFGHVYAAGRSPNRMEAVGWWYRYPEDYFTSDRAHLVGFTEVANVLGPGSDAIERISGRVDDVMAQTLSEPRANLDQIGVAPEAQGLGLGSALVNHIVQNAASSGLPVALWTDAITSVRFYEHNGFGVVRNGEQSEFEIDWWIMFRAVD